MSDVRHTIVCACVLRALTVAILTDFSKVAKVTNFKFGTHAPRQSPDMTPEKKLAKMGPSQRHVTHFFKR